MAGHTRLFEEDDMGLLAWIVVGLVAGIIAKMVVGVREGLIVTILLGIVGAFVGGFVMSLFGYGGVNGLDIWSIVVATLGAVIVLFLVRLVRR
jgi:uncharacterized membrane protein YeaQ/YmgE (transglycosylase-associated protein family)